MIIAGLGNPGKKYENTHHNVGFIMADCLAEHFKTKFELNNKFQIEIAEFKFNGEKHYILKPQMYMNLSGTPIRSFMNYYKFDSNDLIVIHDDMDLAFGKKRIRKSGSSGGHNGIKSIINELGTENFKRIKIGIGHNDAESQEEVVDYVLSKFSKKEMETINQIKDEMPLIIEDMIVKDIEFVMNKYN